MRKTERTPYSPSLAEEEQARFRSRVESFASRLTLPLSQHALGLLEGEHQSDMSGNGFDFLDLREYQAGDSAQAIDWQASARLSRPIVVNRQKDVISTSWLLLDTGQEMMSVTPSGETALQVASNALRLFALLSLRRSDEISLVLADSGTISRLPFNGGYAKFDTTLRDAVEGRAFAPRDLTALLRYAQKIPRQDGLIVLATDATALTAEQTQLMTQLSQNHALVVVGVSTLNPFDPAWPMLTDSSTGRKMPAFLRDESLSQELDRRRSALNEALRLQLRRHADTYVSASSSQEMIDTVLKLISTSMKSPRRAQQSLLATAQKGGK